MRTNGPLIADGDAIVRPDCSDKLDFEGELVIVIGKEARHVKEEDALDYVFYSFSPPYIKSKRLPD